MKLQQQDIVRTRRGTVAVVSEVASDGSVSLVLPARSGQKVAWYKPSELTYISSLQAMIAQIG
jgi:predicted ATPase with chaperone activity